MKNHFYISYIGNKRQEVEKIVENINFDGITTIVEPFCGSCAVSYYISTLYPNRFKYILNDIDDKLIELLNIHKDEDKMTEIIEEFEEFKKDITKEKYKEYVKKGFKGWLFGNKYYAIRPYLYPATDLKRLNTKMEFKDKPIYKFLINEDVEIYNKDAIEIIEQYDKEDCLIFLDPPYLNSCNCMYKNGEGTVYFYLYEKELKNFKANIYIAHEYNLLFKLLFKDYINEDMIYDKKYQMADKKKTQHILIDNRINNK